MRKQKERWEQRRRMKTNGETEVETEEKTEGEVGTKEIEQDQ